MVEAPNTRISQLHILHQSDISAIAVAAGDQDQHQAVASQSALAEPLNSGLSLP
jgi:hypothetical protein